ncbi:hypothetical protein EZS27_021869 [termite gut metagenome]|uniref:Uncharacterized protein n=1 Tax=termite gut metagenome TaxID=433724 RepID=A0A5J4R566_9ZZZZ
MPTYYALQLKISNLPEKSLLIIGIIPFSLVTK